MTPLDEKAGVIETAARAIEDAYRAQGEAAPLTDEQWGEMKARHERSTSGTSMYSVRMAQAKAALSIFKAQVPHVS